MRFPFLQLPLLVPWEYPSLAPPSQTSSPKSQHQYQYQQPFSYDTLKHPSKQAHNPLDEKFERRVEWMLEHFNVPGLSIAVVNGNDTFLQVILPF
jgi:hypothetical protein